MLPVPRRPLRCGALSSMLHSARRTVPSPQTGINYINSPQNIWSNGHLLPQAILLSAGLWVQPLWSPQGKRPGSREVKATFPEETASLCLESGVATTRPNLQRTRAAPLYLFGNFQFGNNFKVTEKLQIQNKEIPCTLYPDSRITYILLYFLHRFILSGFS